MSESSWNNGKWNSKRHEDNIAALNAAIDSEKDAICAAARPGQDTYSKEMRAESSLLFSMLVNFAGEIDSERWTAAVAEVQKSMAESRARIKAAALAGVAVEQGGQQ